MALRCCISINLEYLAQTFATNHLKHLKMNQVKALVVRALEKHPYGYRLGLFLLDNLDILLPHESDYLAFPILAKIDSQARVKNILDIGANRGHSSRAFLKLLPDFKVIAFEANSLHKKKLEQIHILNSSKFSFHLGAVTNVAKGDLTLFTPFYGKVAMHSASALSRSEALSGVDHAFPAQAGQFTIQETTTPTLNIDSLNLEFSFVKLDIQGEELPALQGMSETISRCMPAILVEMNLMQNGISNFLSSKGYHPFTYNAAKKEMVPGYGPHSTHYRNQFFLPPRLVSKL